MAKDEVAVCLALVLFLVVVVPTHGVVYNESPASPWKTVWSSLQPGDTLILAPYKPFLALPSPPSALLLGLPTAASRAQPFGFTLNEAEEEFHHSHLPNPHPLYRPP